MSLISRAALIRRLRRGKASRQQFVESHLSKGIAHQIRAIRDRLGRSQERLAKEVGMTQNAISRLESPEYGKPTITTLKRLAAAFDVGLIVRFVPFSEMVDWVIGTPRLNMGLSAETLAIPNFGIEEKKHVFDAGLTTTAAAIIATTGGALELRLRSLGESNVVMLSQRVTGDVPRKPVGTESTFTLKPATTVHGGQMQ